MAPFNSPGCSLPSRIRRALPTILVLSIFILNSNCHPPFPKRHPPSATTSVCISNIFPNCHNPSSSTNIISYQIQLSVWYYDPNGFLIFDQTPQVSSGTQPWINACVPVKIPSDGTMYFFEIRIIGTQCSTCALLTPDCQQPPTPDGHLAGFPQLYKATNGYSGYQPSFTFTNLPQIENASCGCDVPAH